MHIQLVERNLDPDLVKLLDNDLQGLAARAVTENRIAPVLHKVLHKRILEMICALILAILNIRLFLDLFCDIGHYLPKPLVILIIWQR